MNKIIASFNPLPLDALHTLDLGEKAHAGDTLHIFNNSFADIILHYDDSQASTFIASGKHRSYTYSEGMAHVEWEIMSFQVTQTASRLVVIEVEQGKAD